MSSQGTIDIGERAFEELLLKAWGEWAKTSGVSLGYSKLIKTEMCGILFTHAEMMRVDRAIAKLPKPFKRVLRKTYIAQVIEPEDDQIYKQAMAAFYDSMAEQEASNARTG